MNYKVLAQKINACSVVVLTLNLLTTTIVAPPSNASKWQMGFNSSFKGLNLKEGGHLVNLVLGGEIILKWTLKQYDGKAWIEFIWLRRGTSGGLL